MQWMPSCYVNDAGVRIVFQKEACTVGFVGYGEKYCVTCIFEQRMNK